MRTRRCSVRKFSDKERPPFCASRSSFLISPLHFPLLILIVRGVSCVFSCWKCPFFLRISNSQKSRFFIFSRGYFFQLMSSIPVFYFLSFYSFRMVHVLVFPPFSSHPLFLFPFFLLFWIRASIMLFKRMLKIQTQSKKYH